MSQNLQNSFFGSSYAGDLVPQITTGGLVQGSSSWPNPNGMATFPFPDTSYTITTPPDYTAKAIKIARLFYKGTDIDEFLSLVDQVKEVL